MRIRVLSNLHREFGTTDLPDITTELVVPAGDIDRGIKGVISTRQAFPKVPVLYVAGNHEHYDERIGRQHEKLREAADKRTSLFWRTKYLNWADGAFSVPRSGRTSISSAANSPP